MRLAFSTNAYLRFSFREAVTRLARIGYTGVEIMADVPHAWPAWLLDEQKQGLRDALAASASAESERAVETERRENEQQDEDAVVEREDAQRAAPGSRPVRRGFLVLSRLAPGARAILYLRSLAQSGRLDDALNFHHLRRLKRAAA
ncbi:hypothetical protein B4Q13_18350 [Lacticaseibacillus rhamnosus]